VELCNFLDSCGESVKSFSVSSSSESLTPFVMIESVSDVVKIYRNQTLSLSGEVYIPNCEGSELLGQTKNDNSGDILDNL